MTNRMFCLLMTLSSMASGNTLEKFFESLGAEANASESAAFHDQAAGYYTGGGLMVRQKNTSYQPLNISPPSFSAGCSGIDAYFGSISFMKKNELVNMIRQMGTHVGTYAFQLAMKTMAPQVENLLSQLRKLALDINSLMIGDCRQVQQIFAAALPKGTAFQEHACIDVRKQSGHEDWFGAKEKCSEPGNMVQGAKDAQIKSPDLLVAEFNLTWHILKKLKDQGSLLEADMEFWLTMVGTIVRKDLGRGDFETIFYSGKAADELTWQHLLKGGRINGLVCGDREKCLDVQSQVIPIEEGLGEKIGKQIRTLQRKYLANREDLSPEDLTFLNNVAELPLWKYIQVLSARGSSARFEAIHDYIALRILLSQLDSIISEVDAHMHVLQGKQMEAEKIKEYRDHLHNLKTQLHQRQGPMTQQTMFQLNQMIEADEKHVRLVHGLSS